MEATNVTMRHTLPCLQIEEMGEFKCRGKRVSLPEVSGWWYSALSLDLPRETRRRTVGLGKPAALEAHRRGEAGVG